MSPGGTTDRTTTMEDRATQPLGCWKAEFRNKNADNSKVTMEAQLGLIGGTMGLLTGFSILSGVEIIYYLLRFFFGLL